MRLSIIIFFFFQSWFATDNPVSLEKTNEIAGPVNWNVELVMKGRLHTIQATATIDDNWVVYSHYTDKGGPIPTQIFFDDVLEIGALREEGKLISEMSELFEITVSKYKNEVTFTQSFSPKLGQKEVSGHVRFMTCDGEKCLPPKDVDFSFEL